MGKHKKVNQNSKNQNWNNDEYQNGVIIPYRNIQKLQEKIENEDRDPSINEMAEALELFKIIIHTKKISNDVHVEFLRDIFKECNVNELFYKSLI